MSDGLAAGLANARFREHILQRTVVLPDLRLLFLPVPKAGCTSVLWLLADLTGLPRERFTDSASAEVDPLLTVHDMQLWGPEHQLGALSDDERERALTEDGWLRFAVVREPGARLWSAWQSKVLLREPRFVERFAEAPWFPALPTDADTVLADFRRFVSALGPDGPLDVHWCVQRELTDALPLNHIGRIEHLGDTLRVLSRHLPEGVTPLPELARDNRALLPMPAAAYDDTTAKHVNDLYDSDQQAFGYPPVVVDTTSDGWTDAVEPVLPTMRTVIARHERVGTLSALAHGSRRQLQEADELRRKVHELEEQVATLTGADRRVAGKAAVSNREGRDDFRIEWGWARDEPLASGFTAVVRVKNEAAALPWVLPPLLRAVRAVILVDNESTDGTPDVARDIAQREGAADRLTVRSYPFTVSKCGPEHLETPPDSVHSLTYFYNWTFSLVQTTYALKWDGDMVLTETGVNALRDLAWQIETGEFVVMMPRYPLYVADDSTAYLDVSVANREYWGWPNRKGYEHAKAFEWELSSWPLTTKSLLLPDWSCIELKHLDVDEFAHWSQDDFTTTTRTTRKRRESEVYDALQGEAPPPDFVLRIDAPAGRHVIDYVRSEWIPEEKPRLRELNKKARGRQGLRP